MVSLLDSLVFREPWALYGERHERSFLEGDVRQERKATSPFLAVYYCIETVLTCLIETGPAVNAFLLFSLFSAQDRDLHSSTGVQSCTTREIAICVRTLGLRASAT